ncbi:MAG: hypothetical protein A3F11_01255 [Gammaproteobacteria bacterium RIFCSPHIGHO2_12_FULL_37_14]|nr:MAG: hypothetical protein A3F11_01255 [Gammaproteobacteria bacterium RIFCSPHIGHO2_12_FULL_37_14]
MYWIEHHSAIGCFGSAQENLKKDGKYYALSFHALREKIFHQTKINLLQVVFPKQIHGADVWVLDEPPLNLIEYNQIEADAVITRCKNIGIGVITADCLPVFVIDSEHKAIAAIHAGWKGLSKKIITETIKKMQVLYRSDPAQLQIYFGPSAGVCCYEVQPDFLQYFPEDVFKKNIVVKTGASAIHFDAKHCAIDELYALEVPLHAINTTYHQCTICNPTFCSFRREKDHAGRQPSVIFLRS